MNIVEFLTVREAERARIAQILLDHPDIRWAQGDGLDGDPGEVYAHVGLDNPSRCDQHPLGSPNMCSDNRIITVDDDFVPSEAQTAAMGAHVAFHDPAWVLADVAAKRAILEIHRPCVDSAWPQPGHCGECWDTQAEDWRPMPCPTVRALVQPYADHLDFDPSWRVERARSAHVITDLRVHSAGPVVDPPHQSWRVEAVDGRPT